MISETNVIYCIECGATVNSNENFCQKCGYAIENKNNIQNIKDIPSMYLVYLLVMYSIITFIIYSFDETSSMASNIGFSMGFSIAGLLMTLPIIGIIYIIQKIRKIKYKKPILHIAMGTTIMFIISTLGSLN